MVRQTLYQPRFYANDRKLNRGISWNAFNPTQFRAQFPALADASVYLDSAATALKPQQSLTPRTSFIVYSS